MQYEFVAFVDNSGFQGEKYSSLVNAEWGQRSRVKGHSQYDLWPLTFDLKKLHYFDVKTEKGMTIVFFSHESTNDLLF